MVLQVSGPISFSQIRNEFGGPTSVGPISISQYRSGGTYGSQISANPNSVPNTNSNIKFSNFFSAAKWTYPSTNFATLTNSTVQGAWSITNQDSNAKNIWIDPFQSVRAPIANYGINFYYIFQNTTGGDILGTIYVFQDNDATYYLNGVNLGNYTYSGVTNSISTTFKVGQNLFQAYVVNTGGPGGFQLTFKDLSGKTIMYTLNGTWRTDAFCMFEYTNWYWNGNVNYLSVYNASGSYPSMAGTDPDVQYQLGFGTGNTKNMLYTSYFNPVTFNSFTLYFEIYINSNSGADSLYCFFGSNSLSIQEDGGYNSFTLDFHIYASSRTQGIYLMNPSKTTVGQYITSGFIASAWQPVIISYTKGTSNTWSVFWNGTNVFNYSDPNNASFVANAGQYFGVAFRDGGITGTAYVRHFQMYRK